MHNKTPIVAITALMAFSGVGHAQTFADLSNATAKLVIAQAKKARADAAKPASLQGVEAATRNGAPPALAYPLQLRSGGAGPGLSPASTPAPPAPPVASPSTQPGVPSA